MAKYKPAGSKKPVRDTKAKGAIPCVIILVFGIRVRCLLFYFMFQSLLPVSGAAQEGDSNRSA